MKTTTILENANKVAFLVQQYPERSLPEVIKLLGMPAININTAIWYAAEMGWISEPDKEEGAVRFLAEPNHWNFGDVQNTLYEMIAYSFQQLSKKEADLEENYLSNWTHGYADHEVMIALRRLLNDKVLATYEVEDGKDKYVFYTSYADRDKQWGRKQFKKEATPADTTDEVNDKQEQ